jgi:hypothetical protein
VKAKVATDEELAAPGDEVMTAAPEGGVVSTVHSTGDDAGPALPLASSDRTRNP